MAGSRPDRGQNRDHLGAQTCTAPGSAGRSDLANLARALLGQAVRMGNPPELLKGARRLLEEATLPAAPLRLAARRAEEA